MKTLSFFTILLGLLIFHTAMGSSADEEKLAAANNVFAFKLLKEIASEQPTTNIFISPYSASTVLQMVANGAAGRTKTEMQKVLGMSTASIVSGADLNAANKQIAKSIHDGNPNVILETANAIWCHKTAEIKPDFIACNQHYFGATVALLDFADPHAADVINNWASEKTHGRITQIADPAMLDPIYGRLFLANAVYFKGKWSDPFEVRDTQDRPFHLRNGSQKIVPMMNKSKTFTYRSGTGYQAVRLPYQGENLAMYVFLPDTNSSPEKLLHLMSGDVWRRITKPGFADEEGDLQLPRFKMDYSVGLVEPLQKLGMKTAFDMDKADFSGMSLQQLYISSVLQKTFVEVKEEGTEAAAVTGIAQCEASCLPMTPPKHFEMIVNRPFLFLMEDNQTGTILFMGLIYDPSN